MNGDVLDITEGKDEPGMNIITWGKKKKEFENQLWYEDKQGILRSKLGDFAIDDSGERIKENHKSQFILLT